VRTHPDNFIGVHQRRIGLTGGIAMGKTTVANYLASAYQFPVLDADVYAREAVRPGSAVFAKVVERYGTEILLPDGMLDRKRLGNIIFENSQEQRWLETQIHPYVRQCLHRELETLKQHAVIVLVIPLLLEAQMTNFVTEIWVVSCSEAKQVERLMQRNSLTLKQAQTRIASQMPIAQKIAQATVVLDNSSTPDALLRQVDAVLK